MRVVYVTESQVVNQINGLLDEARRNNKTISFIELTNEEWEEILDFDKAHAVNLLSPTYKGTKIKIVEV